ncbi:MAG: hypothetical protein DWQ08_15975 [Proteobacteria bacterium]|nr:MAG: hypothetical protein DWQ08_15975 [Pseudomonadota bacterium]
MLLILGGGGDLGTRIENRLPEPAANPYLVYASQIHAGIDGLERGLEPCAPASAPYESEGPALPGNLMEAIALARADTVYRDAFGALFVDYLAAIKESEFARFNAEVTDWEQREYFELM